MVQRTGHIIQRDKQEGLSHEHLELDRLDSVRDKTDEDIKDTWPKEKQQQHGSYGVKEGP